MTERWELISAPAVFYSVRTKINQKSKPFGTLLLSPNSVILANETEHLKYEPIPLHNNPTIIAQKVELPCNNQHIAN